ncbi:hypothetical protein FOTG_07943 [Fusarium oxysporum f. sp. vasinfectum 25433]|uniref:Uncharacterized protein n=1 Tax=Fusarium oxysporum f. sp. vasinfectum 25433 TaxID=1089449 RepID=X0LGD0_FUSOX|nr:hypothetical protein FOTG_07943 [Fusarium oxysporum f. sp. vasinfectum 25433]
MMLLAVIIRRYSDQITYCAVDDSSVLQGSAKEWPLKWVTGRRLRPTEDFAC